MCQFVDGTCGSARSRGTDYVVFAATVCLKNRAVWGPEQRQPITR